MLSLLVWHWDKWLDVTYCHMLWIEIVFFCVSITVALINGAWYSIRVASDRKPMVSWAQDLFLRDDLLPEPPGLHGGICHILWTGGRWVEGGYEACIVEYKLGKLGYGICVIMILISYITTLHSYNECDASICQLSRGLYIEADEKFMANSHDDVGPSHSMSIGQN